MSGYSNLSPRDKAVRALLDAGKLRPKKGSLWCEKLLEHDEITVDGVGVVTGSVTSSGLVLVGSGGNSQDQSVKSKLLLVRAVGESPDAWSFRYFDKERNWGALTFASQNVDVGTVLCVRAVSGKELEADARFIEVRYDEIVAIGQPEGVGEHDMLPAPGWVLLDMTVDAQDCKVGIIYVREDAYDVVSNGEAQWATVLALAGGASEVDGMEQGSRVLVDRYKFTEYVQIGNLRFVPIDEVLGVEE